MTQRREKDGGGSKNTRITSECEFEDYRVLGFTLFQFHVLGFLILVLDFGFGFILFSAVSL